jgi:hypothetical protein
MMNRSALYGGTLAIAGFAPATAPVAPVTPCVCPEPVLPVSPPPVSRLAVPPVPVFVCVVPGERLCVCADPVLFVPSVPIPCVWSGIVTVLAPPALPTAFAVEAPTESGR